MLWASLDVDIIDDPVFLELCLEDGHNFFRFLRLVQAAKKAQSGGQIILTEGRPLTAKTLAIMHRESVTLWESFLEKCNNLDLIGWNSAHACWEILDWMRWHRKPSDSKTSVNLRVKKHREIKKKATSKCNADVTPCNAPVTPCNAFETPLKRDETRCNAITARVTERVITTERDPAKQPDPIFPQETPQNQGLEGGNAGRSLMVAGVKTISSTANRLAAIVQRCFPTFIPKIQEADTLVLDMIAICKRQSKQWQDNYTEGDFELGLDLASRHAEALEQEGRGPHKLLAWIREVNGRKYIDLAHDWRKTNEKRAEKGKEPLSPLEPDLSELERRR